MNKAVITLIIICLVLGGIVGYIYYTYELPKKYQEVYTNVSIGAFYNNKFVATSIELNGEIFNISNSYELFRLRPNQTISIKNINKINQTFYEDTKEVLILSENKRIDLLLDKPAKLDIFTSESNKLININLYSENFKEVEFCLKWSLNYVFIKAINFSEIKKPQEFRNYDRCYSGNFSLLNGNKTISISYQILDYPTEKDFINISIYDKGKNIINRSLL